MGILGGVRVFLLLDGVEIPDSWLTEVSIDRRMIVVKARVDESHDQGMILARLTNYSDRDVVEFDCEDDRGRQVSGVGTIKEIMFAMSNTAGSGSVFELRIGFCVS